MKSLFFAVLALCFAGPVLAAETLQSNELPPAVQAFAAQGISIDKSMPAPPGFKGYVGDFQGRKLPVYLLPDGKHVVVGSIYGPTGDDLTSASFRAASEPVFGDAEWQQLAAAKWIPEGAADPERIVYVFTDTECPYCHRLWQQSLDLLQGSKTQVRHVIVAVISPKSAPRAAAILTRADPAAALQEHEHNFGHSPFADSGEVPSDIKARLGANAALMNRLGVFGTPALLYRDSDGTVRVQAGVPQSEQQLREILLGK